MTIEHGSRQGVELQWNDAAFSKLPLTPALWFYTARDMDGIHLVVGQTTIPLHPETAASVQIEPVARLLMTTKRAIELRNLLSRVLEGVPDANPDGN